MSELMHIVDKLRDAAVHAKKNCDAQIESTVSKIQKELTDNINAHRDSQLQLHQQLVQEDEKQQTQRKHIVEENAKHFEKLKQQIIALIDTHKQKQKECEHKMALLYSKFQKQKSKQGTNLNLIFKVLDKCDAEEWAHLAQRLKSRLQQKANHCKTLMLRQDDLLVKINNMLSNNSNNVE